MGEGFKNWFASTSSSSSSVKVLLFVVPMILGTGFASVFVLKGSSWVFIYSHPFSKTTLESVKIPALQAKERDGLADLRLQVLTVDDHSRKEAFSNETAINNSASSRIVAKPLQVQQNVRAFSLIDCFYFLS